MTKYLAAVLCGILLLSVGCANRNCCKDKNMSTTQKCDMCDKK